MATTGSARRWTLVAFTLACVGITMTHYSPQPLEASGCYQLPDEVFCGWAPTACRSCPDVAVWKPAPPPNGEPTVNCPPCSEDGVSPGKCCTEVPEDPTG